MANSRLLQTLVAAFLALGALASSCLAEGVAVEAVLTGLNVPLGVAVRPAATGAHEIYVAEGGAGRIVRMRSDQPNASTEVIHGLPMSALDTSAAEPIGMLFLDRERLVVVSRGEGGDSQSSAAIVGLYDVQSDSNLVAADAMKQHVELPADSQTQATAGGRNLAVARTRPNDHVPDMLLVTSPNTGQSHELFSIPVRAGTFGEGIAFPLSKGRLPAGTPTAIAVNEQGYVVLGFRGGDSARVSHLAFVNPMDGSIVMELAVELPGLIGLAYGSSLPALYAIALGETAGGNSGVYRIDSSGEVGKPTALAVKFADVKRPAAIAAGPDGALYVTDVGESADASTKQGQLLKLTGEF